MRHRHAPAALFATVLAVTACGAPPKPAPASAPFLSPAPSPSATPVKPAFTQLDYDDYCRNHGVTATVTLQGIRDDPAVRRGLVTLTNATDRDCTIVERASIVLTDADGEVVRVPRDYVDQPRPAAPVTLEPGTSAFQGIKWTTCDRSEESCRVGSGLRFNLESVVPPSPAELEGFPPGGGDAITMASLQLGTTQPTPRGVVAW
ncbi:DUF4232 domain-containing protein [Actinoplanes sp. NPDC023714]|uniref:DUF4232 domain-containing protein n=1 Tax=Actinoplanes sp. NPDC023714 TaxID=3154322 RepID=UPI0033D774D7